MTDSAVHTWSTTGPRSGDFAWEVPERFNFARDVVGGWARDPEQLAMLWLGADGEERRLTFRDFAERAECVARVLQRHGLRPGDRVMVPCVPALWEVLLGCFQAGAVVVPGTVLLTPKDIAYRTQASEGVAYICDVENAVKVDEVRAECPSLRTLLVAGAEPPSDGWRSLDREMEEAGGGAESVDTLSTDPALIYFTSGTVGNPKMCCTPTPTRSATT